MNDPRILRQVRISTSISDFLKDNAAALDLEFAEIQDAAIAEFLAEHKDRSIMYLAPNNKDPFLNVRLKSSVLKEVTNRVEIDSARSVPTLLYTAFKWYYQKHSAITG